MVFHSMYRKGDWPPSGITVICGVAAFVSFAGFSNWATMPQWFCSDMLGLLFASGFVAFPVRISLWPTRFDLCNGNARRNFMNK